MDMYLSTVFSSGQVRLYQCQGAFQLTRPARVPVQMHYYKYNK